MNLFSVPTGVTPGGIALAFLEFSTVILFLVGCILFCKIVSAKDTKKGLLFAIIGTILCFVGGFPNACDKLSWALFKYDLIFDSSWMFAGVGPGYICLFLGIYFCRDKKTTKVSIFALPIMIIILTQLLPSSIKYVGMLLAAVGMIGFYAHMIKDSKKIIGKYWVFYLIAIIMTLFLVVFSAKGTFNSLWPNMLAQTCNNISYLGFILANLAWLRKIKCK